LNFTAAAAGLAVTQTAASHQIKTLEDWFGKPLFTRQARNVALTASGQALYGAVSDAFDLIADAASSARG
jgi:LysR family transcriptional regulator, glycine cleavage system transcriptional activator